MGKILAQERDRTAANLGGEQNGLGVTADAASPYP